MLATLVQTINTFEFAPPSPDPAGLAYLPATDTLLISDSEVNEMSIFTGDNMFETTLSGSLVSTWSTLSYSDEPTGIDVNPANGNLFISDDTGTRRIYEWGPGSDGLYQTGDDVITSFNTSDFGSSDPEGVAFDTHRGHLFVADGDNARIYEVSPGPNGVFDGVTAPGDDQVTSFDVAALGVFDPEGIAFHPSTGHLFVVGQPAHRLLEVTTDGTLVQQIDISAANPIHPAGLAVAPGSQDSGVMSLYVADRGTDNNADPNENDGRLFEISLPSPNRTSQTAEFVSVNDAYIDQDHPQENKGDANDLKVKPDAGKQRRSLVEFDLASIPENSNVLDATLLLYEDNEKDKQTVYVHRMTADWVESEVTWTARSDSNPWVTRGGDFDSTPLASFAPNIEDVYREIGITNVVQDWVDGTSVNHGLLLRSAGANGEVKFKSRDEGNVHKRPTLRVTYELTSAGGVTISESGGSTRVTEAGATDSYTLDLDTLPEDNVDITVTPDAQTDLGAGPGTAIVLTFTPTNAFVPQYVTVKAVDDEAIEGLHTSTITHTANSSDWNYSGLPIDSVTANIVDNDTGTLSVEFVSTQDTFINQDHPRENKGDDKDLKVKPDAGKERRSLVAFDLASIPANSSVLDATLLLYEDNERDKQTVNVHRMTAGWVESEATWIAASDARPWATAGGDFDATPLASFAPNIEKVYREIDITRVVQAWVDGNSANHGLLLKSTGANGEVKFKSRQEGNVDKRPLLRVTYQLPSPAGVTVNESGGSTDVTEAGARDSYTLVLDTLPRADVDVTVKPDIQTDLGAGPGTAIVLTFTPGNAFVPQTVDVKAVDDQAVEGAHISTITHTASSSDTDYNGFPIKRVTANIEDNDTARGTIQYLSLNSGTTLPNGLTVANEDLVTYDGADLSLYLDGSDVGLGSTNLDAFAVISANEFLFSFRSVDSLAGIGTVEDSDLVKFTATELGETTSGTLELFFRGSEVGLSPVSEDVDAVELLDDGQLIVSTSDNFEVAGLTGRDEDLIAFTPDTPGDYSSGAWAMYLDGSDVGLASEDVDGIAMQSNGDIHLSTTNTFAIKGIVAEDEDSFVFVPSQLGTDTAGSFASTIFFDGSDFGLDASDVNAIELPANSLVSSTEIRSVNSDLTVTLNFNAVVDATTLQPADLIVNGSTSATGMILNDADTATFTIAALPGGTHTLRINAGAVGSADGTQFGAWSRTFAVVTDGQYTINHSPRLQLGDAPLVGFAGSATDQVELLWQTVSAGSGTQDSFALDYRLSGTSNPWLAAPATSQIPISTGGRINHYTEITGLSYDTDYEYRLRHFAADVIVEEYTSVFHTRLPAGDQSAFSFAAYGDCHGALETRPPLGASNKATLLVLFLLGFFCLSFGR